MGTTAALEEEEEEEGEEEELLPGIRFSRSRCGWLAKLRELQEQGTKQHCPGIPNSSTTFAFGLPPGDFSQSVSCKEARVVLQEEPRGARKRKQERPSRSLPRSSSLQQESGGEPGKRRSRSWDWELQHEDSANPNPPCRMQLTRRRDYGFHDESHCSDEEEKMKMMEKKKRKIQQACSSTPTSWRSCMEKMQACSLRSDSSSSTNSESEATLDCQNSELQEEDEDEDDEEEEQQLKRVVVEDQGPLLLQEKEKSHNQQQESGSRATTTVLLQQQNGFVADFHTRAALKLPPDHPACQPKDTLVYSLYQVFTKAGKSGLTPREAVSKILDRKLPGLDDGGLISARVEVVKIVRNSPYFMELEESKFVLWSAITGLEEKPSNTTVVGNSSSGLHSWAALAVRRARTTGKTRRKQVYSIVGGGGEQEKKQKKKKKKKQEEEEQRMKKKQQREVEEQFSRKRRLKSVQQDCTGLGNRCNRSDGKGWHCPLRAQVGYLLCDHHLDRLRSKSSGSKPRRPNRKRGRGKAAIELNSSAADQAGRNELKRRSSPSPWGTIPQPSLRAGRSSKRIKQQRLLQERENQEDDLCGEEQEEVITTTFGLVL